MPPEQGHEHGHGRDALAKFCKHPTTHNATIILGVLAAIAVQPGLLPYASADHEHDIAKVQAVIVATVQNASLRANIQNENNRINDLDAQILSGLCMPTADPCMLEKVFRKQAEQRRRAYRNELLTLELRPRNSR